MRPRSNAPIDPAEVERRFEQQNEMLHALHRVIVDLRQHQPVAVQFIIQLVTANGYVLGKLFDRTRYGAVRRLLYTHGLIYGAVGDDHAVDGSYCYHDERAASDALLAWDGAGDPLGWHRHTASGRRLAEQEGEIDGQGREIPVGTIYVRL